MFDRTGLQRAWNNTHQEKPIFGQPQKELIAFIEHLKCQTSTGISILDAGCGRGRNLFYLHQAGFNVYGCDLSSVALKVAKAQAELEQATITFQVANLIQLPYAEGRFTAAVCSHVLPYHFKADIAANLCELWRVLQWGGWLFFDLLACEDAEYGCGEELEAHTFWDVDGVPVHFSSRQEVEELLSGFAIERLERIENRISQHRVRVSWEVWVRKL